MLTRLIPERLKRWVKWRAGVFTAVDRLINLRDAGFRPTHIIDAGAFRGEWSLAVTDVFPAAKILMIEPQPDKAGVLEQICQNHSGIQMHAALLGNSADEVSFLMEESNSRIALDTDLEDSAPNLIRLPVARLDKIAKEERFEDCQFLKLDLQGHELEALAGAGSLFGQVEVIQIEVSILKIGPVPLAEEVIRTFTEHSYQLYDIFEPRARPLDQALWQIDFLFVQKSSALISSRNWA